MIEDKPHTLPFRHFFDIIINKVIKTNYRVQRTTYVRLRNAPINVNQWGAGGVRARGGDLTNFKILRSNSPGWETKGQSKVSKKPHPKGKNLNKQYYNTV